MPAFVVLVVLIFWLVAVARVPDEAYAQELTAQLAGDAVEDCPAWTTRDPLPAWAGRMPQPRATGVLRIDAQVTSANGDRIFVRVYLPDAYEPYERPLPTVLQLWHFSTLAGSDVATLCELESPSARWASPLVFLLRRGYAVVIADDPGIGNSTGCWDLGGPAEQQAGKAVVDWIAAQRWSDGTVAMRGLSAGGLSQLATAATRPAALKAISPGSPTPPYEAFHTGATTMEQRGLTALLFGLQAAPATDPTSPDYADTLVDVACPGDYVKWNDPDGTLDAYWRERHLPLLAARSNAAVLTTVGSNPFTDPVRVGWDPMWRALEENGVPRKGFVGPWGHQPPTIDNWSLHELRWFEHWLRGNDTGVMAEPSLTLIDQDNNERVATHFPTQTVSFHASAGRLGGSPERGTATYTDVPGAPQAVLRESGGSLDYVGEPASAPVRLSGAGQLRLSASIDSTDTDFVAIVYDRAPDGSQQAITWGYLDARHRKALDQPGEPVIPGVVEQYRVQLAGTEWTLRENHRLALYLASSDGCTPASAVFGPDAFSPPCSEIGHLRSDGSQAKVTVHEGPGLTRLEFPSDPN